MEPPARIVFSRKGLDSAAGGTASPIVDGRPISLPIPSGRYPGGRPYRDLAGGRAALAEAMGRGVLRPDTSCHLDPDIDPSAVAGRPAGWRGAFGQVGAALGHLRRQQVGVGDLFLFFGRFRCWEERMRRDRDVHAIYGWLRVGAVIDDVAQAPAWLCDHPHVAPGWPAANAIYVAAERLGLAGAAALPGAGVFARAAVLSVAPGVLSRWRVPAWLERARMTYHRDDRCWPGDGTMLVNGQWQEGIARADAEACAWAARLIATHADGVPLRPGA